MRKKSSRLPFVILLQLNDKHTSLEIQLYPHQEFTQMRQTCSCVLNAVQTESHVLLECPLSAELRAVFDVNVASISELVDNCSVKTVDFVYRVKKLFDEASK